MGAPEYKDGEPIALESLQQMADLAFAAGRADALGTGPLDPAGGYIGAIDQRPQFWARLTDFADPYFTFKEVYWQGDTWVDVQEGYGGTLNAINLSGSFTMNVDADTGDIVWMRLADGPLETGAPWVFEGYDWASVTPGNPNQFWVTNYDGLSVGWKGGTESKSASFTVALTDHKKTFLITTSGDLPVTLPAIDDVHEGFEVWFHFYAQTNVSDAIRVNTAGSDRFESTGLTGVATTILNRRGQVLGIYASTTGNVWIQLTGPAGIFSSPNYSLFNGYVTTTAQKWYGEKTFHETSTHLTGISCGPFLFSDILPNFEICFSLGGFSYKWPDETSTTDSFSPLLEAVHEWGPGVVLAYGTGPAHPNSTYTKTEFVAKYKLMRYHVASATLYPDAVAAIRYPLEVQYDSTDLTPYVIFDFRSEVIGGGGGRVPLYACGGVLGVETGTFTSLEGSLVTVTGGLVTAIVSSGMMMAPGQVLRSRPARLTSSASGGGSMEKSLPIPSEQPLEWISTKRLVEDSIRLAGMLPSDTVAVAGIPRSGMVVAATIAAHLQIPLYEITGEYQLHRLGNGSRGDNLGFASATFGVMAIVDDTVYTGAEMARTRESLKRSKQRIVTSAVYCRPEVVDSVDFCARELPAPHLLEWNIANNGPVGGYAEHASYGAGVAFDLDGVIVHDRHSGGPVGSPYLVPRTIPVPLIATGRRESSRQVAEGQLRAVGAQYDRLAMLPDDDPGTVESFAAFKARAYQESGCGFFIESDPSQAALIHRLTGLPVICPRLDTVLAACNRPVATSGRMPLTAEPEEPHRYATPANSTHGLVQMLELVTKEKGAIGRVVEIGAFRGVSTEVLSGYAREVVAVDVWGGRPEIEAEFKKLLGRRSNVSVLREMSPGAASNFADGSLDLVYIDGSHQYANVVNDIRAWVPKIRAGGWISGHDYTSDICGGDVVSAVNDLLGPPWRIFPDGSWLVRVDQPPVLFRVEQHVPDPHSDWAVIVCCADDYGRQMLEVSGPLLEHYARRLGADLVVVREGHHPLYPTSIKWRLVDVIASYERSVYFDLDVVFNPATLPNLFEVCPSKCVGAYTSGYLQAPMFERSYRAHQLWQNVGPFGLERYVNNGVIVLDREHAGLFTAPLLPVATSFVVPWRGLFTPTDQNHLNALLAQKKVPFFPLPEQFNWMNRDGPEGLSIVRHFAGVPGRVAAMKEYASRCNI